MPYVITTTPRPTHSQLVARIDGVELPCTRIAVATPDEARQAIIDIGAAHDTWIGGDALHGPIDRNGGTIGPLADGTVIEVRQVGWGTLASQAGFAQYSDERPTDNILAAFNAR